MSLKIFFESHQCKQGSLPPIPPLHKAAQLCCVKAMPLNRISCCLLTPVIVFSFFIQFAEEPWFSYQATYLLTNIPTYLKSTYLPLTYALFLPNNIFLPPSQCVLVHWPILHSSFLFFNFLASESRNTKGNQGRKLYGKSGFIFV